MKLLKSFSSFMVLGLAVSVTIGSMYVTVSAAARQDEAQELVPDPAPLGFEEIAPVSETAISNPTPVPAVPTVGVDDETLEVDEIRSDRQHHINLDANGGFTGTLSALGGSSGMLQPASGMQVRVIMDGSVIASTSTAADGGFSFTGLRSGVIALLAYSDTGLLLYGARLVEGGNVFADATPVKFEATSSLDLQVSSAIVSGADLQVARELIFGNLPTRDLRFTEAATEKEESYNYGSGETGTAQASHVVKLSDDGTLKGQLNLLDPRTGRHREVTDLTLHFIRNGELVASTIVQRSGDFEVLGLIPGVHSVVSTGQDGVLAVGLDIVGSAFNQATAGERYKYARVLQTVRFGAAPANAGNFNSGNAGAVSEGNLDPSNGGDGSGGGAAPGVAGGPIGPAGGAGGPMGAPGGGFSGGTGGGGGGIGGGGGGLGSLLGAAAAGALGYALGDSSPGR